MKKGLELKQKVKGKKVAVAMSGGVDSSVCALLLKKAGAEIFGITMKVVPWARCCLPEDIRDAKKVAEKLQIKHHVIDLKKEFEKEVIDYFCRESKKGRNPNPCVICNKKIKFGLLLKKAQEMGAEFLATGHYARLNFEKEEPILKRPVDAKKDQSYAMAMIPKRVFSKLIFPIGHYTKKEIKKIAKENKLETNSKTSSQDLCFLNKEKGEFIKNWTNQKEKQGDIVDLDGRLLGKHKGIVHYTIGQRHGLGIKSQKKYYVKKVIPDKNEIVVCRKEDLFQRRFFIKGDNWVSIDRPKKPLEIDVIIRNKMKPKKAIIKPIEKGLQIDLKKPVWAVSPGQIAVFLKDDVVLGGGWIVGNEKLMERKNEGKN